MRVLSSTILAGLALFLAPLVAHAQLADWDQERVTGLSKELKEKSDALYDTYYRYSQGQVGTPGATDAYALKGELRRIKEQTHHLAAALGDGKGREDTMNTYKNLNELVHDAQETIRGMFAANDLVTAAGEAGDVLRRIAPYYDPKANAAPAGSGG